MSEEPEGLILEILRKLQGDLAQMKAGVVELRSEMHGVRTQVNSFQADILRVEGRIGGLEIDLDRIKTRLDLHDA